MLLGRLQRLHQHLQLRQTGAVALLANLAQQHRGWEPHLTGATHPIPNGPFKGLQIRGSRGTGSIAARPLARKAERTVFLDTPNCRAIARMARLVDTALLFPLATCPSGVRERSGPHAPHRRDHARHHLQHEPQRDCWDNAAMESFFSSLKTERTSRQRYAWVRGMVEFMVGPMWW